MIRLRHKLLIHALRVFDQLVLIGSLFATLEFSAHRAGTEHLRKMLAGTYAAHDAIGAATLVVGWLYIFNRVVRYETDRLKTLGSQLIDLIKGTAISAFYLLIVSTIFALHRIDTKSIAIIWCASTTIGILDRLLIRWFLMIVRRSGYNYRHLLIIGYNDEARAIAGRIDQNAVLGYKIVGHVAETPVPQLSCSKHPVLGSTTDLKSILEQRPVDEIIVCLRSTHYLYDVYEAVRLSEQLGIVIRVFPGCDGADIFRRFHVERFDGEYVVTLFREQLLLQLLLKRLIDLFGSLVLLLLLSPLLLIVGVIIKLTSPGPIFFIQQRVGMNKRLFKLYKFRSMYADAETRRQELMHLNEMDGPVFKIRNDPRITPIGHWIRKTSIDELPQLFNVLRGHMSLVGPRPPLLDEVDHYDWLYRKRLSIKPGITCLWQISGRNHISFKQWMELDKQYIENWSLWMDLKIIARTIPAVLLLRGAS